MRIARSPEACAVVVFGATGDLTARKLVPALYNLARQRMLPGGFSVVGFARRDWTDQQFRAVMKEAVAEHSREPLGQLRSRPPLRLRHLRRRLRLRPPGRAHGGAG
jgi:glucose-6-phosphate 1-dehydrogenase